MQTAPTIKLDYQTKRMPVPGAPPALPDPSWIWVNILCMAGALVAMIAALVVTLQYPELHVRLVALSVMLAAYVAFVWLGCLLARAKGYHPAVGLAGVTLLGGLALPFLPSDEDDRSPLVVRGARVAYWIGLKHVAALLILWTLVLGAFWNSFESGWVLDNLYIIKLDPRTRAEAWESGPNPTIAPGVVEYFRQDYWWPKGISGLYRPLTSVTYWMNWTLFGGGEDPTGMHAVNLVVHWLNAALLYTLAFVLTRRWAVALIAGLIFGVHPITTESVTNIIGRADQFAALAVLGGLLVWRWAGSLSGWWTTGGFVAVMLITAFGVFSKESAIAIGLVILFFDVVYRWHPVLAKWFGVLLGLALVPLIAAGTFKVLHISWEPMPLGSMMRGLIAAVAVLAGLGTHVFLTGAMSGGRMPSILFSLVFAMIASAFVPAAGVALFGLVVAYEALAGPWWRQKLPEFDRIKWPAVLYTAGFCAFVFLPLAFGAGIWFKAGAEAKLSLVGTLNVLGDSWPMDVARSAGALGWGERVTRASLFVMIGLAAWFYFTVRSVRGRAAMLLAIAAVPFTASWFVEHDARLLLGASAVGFVAAIILTVIAAEDRQLPTPWLALPVVMIAALAASVYLFYAGFALTFTVGWIELVRRNFLPQVLRDSALWTSLIQRFVLGYYLLLPPVIMMIFVRYWIFNIQSTPPETPFLDNPLRGGPFDPLPFWQSRMTAIKVMGKLIYLLFWPVNLSSDYSWDQIPFFLDSRGAFVVENTKAIIALLTIVGAIAAAVWSYRRNQKALSFFILFFFAAILPTSNLPTLIGSIMAERFMYLPLIGFAGAMAITLVWAFDWIWRLLAAWQIPVPWPVRAAVGTLVAAVVFGLFSYRAYIRNFDWRSDITLWEAAIVQSPRSFRCYQSLAFAYYEQDAHGNIDKMIATAEQARPIVDPLPHDRNSSRLYLHLGMYYNIKAEMLSRPDGRGGISVPPEAQAYYRKAVDVLERGMEVDRTFNEVNRKKQLMRGDRPDRIYDSGLSPVYMTLGMSYQRLGRLREAVNAFNYMRQLEPESAEPYFRLAFAYLDQNKPDEAAIALIQAILIEPARRDLLQTLAQIYTLYGEQAHGVFIATNEGTKLNIDHPLVRDHFIGAYRGFIRIFRYSNRPHLAEISRQAAVYRYHMPPALFDSLMVEPIPEVTPDGILYRK